MVGVGERFRAFWRDRDLTATRRLDHYLTEHLPRLVREHELATQEKMRPIDDQLGRHRETVADLETWRGGAVERLELAKRRIGRLEVKHGLGGK